jgi:SAM-dependent methyltransferase
MLRHLVVHADTCELWDAEIDLKSMIWASQYLTPPFRFVTTTTLPHLPFADGYFDLIYAGSVFTHIADLAMAWLLEVKRVLSPTGRAFLSFHDEHTAQILLTQDSASLNAKLIRGVKEKYELIAFDRWPEYWGTCVFYSDEFLAKTLKPVFTVRGLHREAYGYQTAAVLMA